MIATRIVKSGIAIFESPEVETNEKACLSFWFNYHVSIHPKKFLIFRQSM